MQYDSGEVLPGLNEPWNFMGANVVEWASGLAVFLLVSLLGKSAATMMPFMLIGWVGTTVGLASLRRMFPDEERGLRNYVATMCGVCPPGLPRPSRLQPVWSGFPMRGYGDRTKFVQFGLDKLFVSFEENLKPVEGASEVEGSL